MRQKYQFVTAGELRGKPTRNFQAFLIVSLHCSILNGLVQKLDNGIHQSLLLLGHRYTEEGVGMVNKQKHLLRGTKPAVPTHRFFDIKHHVFLCHLWRTPVGTCGFLKIPQGLRASPYCQIHQREWDRPNYRRKVGRNGFNCY